MNRKIVKIVFIAFLTIVVLYIALGVFVYFNWKYAHSSGPILSNNISASVTNWLFQTV
jgi:heme/copper-type cytochrome/quinol oxidase subunit 2